jgi:hypothetical protein
MMANPIGLKRRREETSFGQPTEVTKIDPDLGKARHLPKMYLS